MIVKPARVASRIRIAIKGIMPAECVTPNPIFDNPESEEWSSLDPLRLTQAAGSFHGNQGYSSQDLFLDAREFMCGLKANSEAAHQLKISSQRVC